MTPRSQFDGVDYCIDCLQPFHLNAIKCGWDLVLSEAGLGCRWHRLMLWSLRTSKLTWLNFYMIESRDVVATVRST